MGMDELESGWQDLDLAEYEEWDAAREEAAPLYVQALEDFLKGITDASTFKTKIDSLGKSYPLWGFKGTGQMFFNQLVNAGNTPELADGLRAVLAAPDSADEAKAKLDAFLVLVDGIREHAEAIGVTKPGRGRINFFATFFWELADRESWPTFFPNSRDVLEHHGLLDINQSQPALYLAYRSRIGELKKKFGTTTWGVEHLLWRLGKGAPEPEQSGETTASDDGEGAGANLYASFRAQGLHFPDEIVTSMVLSLATKRFAVLTGISGTGKTQMALGLARHLSTTDADESVPSEPPHSDSTNLYLQLTAPKLGRGRIYLDVGSRATIDDHFGLPERGTSKHLDVQLPDGSVGKVRVNNLGFADPDRELFLLFFLKEVRAWLDAHAKPGDYLHLALNDPGGADLSLDLESGQVTDGGTLSERWALIAVRSDWTDPRGLVGYFNPLTNSYARTTLVDLLLRAADDPNRAYIVVLDEMNLARVEYYFSDFLSSMESGAPIELMSPGVEEELLALGHDEVPAQLDVPPNVSFIGTVNVDETTHAFSPKVLDRANVIEFSEVDIERALGHPADSAGEGLRLTNGQLDPAWLCTDRSAALEVRTLAHQEESFTEALEDVHDLLARFHLHFGYRVIDEVSAFVGHALEKTVGGSEDRIRHAFDLQLQQKILPKLSGGRELEEPLVRLLDYCVKGEKKTAVDMESVLQDARNRLDGGTDAEVEPPRYPGSARKLLRMLNWLADTGFVGALE